MEGAGGTPNLFQETNSIGEVGGQKQKIG